ncbi:MAG: chromatin protein Cren7 [Thermoproteus sp.]
MSDLLEREYEVEVEGKKYLLKPEKIWALQPPGKPGVLIALFRTPDGKKVRKVIAKIPP